MIPKSCAVCAEEIITDGIPVGNCGQKRHVLSTCKHKEVIAVRIVSTVTVLRVGRGRPNIVGQLNNPMFRFAITGANAFSLTNIQDAAVNVGIGYEMRVAQVNFNASNSNSTYVDNGIVRPMSLTFNYIIKT